MHVADIVHTLHPEAQIVVPADVEIDRPESADFIGVVDLAEPGNGAMAGVIPVARKLFNPANTASRAACVSARNCASSSIRRASTPSATAADPVRAYLPCVGRLVLVPLKPTRVDGVHGIRGSAGVRSQSMPVPPSRFTIA
jgi:hypothetical protein